MVDDELDEDEEVEVGGVRVLLLDVHVVVVVGKGRGGVAGPVEVDEEVKADAERKSDNVLSSADSISDSGDTGKSKGEGGVGGGVGVEEAGDSLLLLLPFRLLFLRETFTLTLTGPDCGKSEPNNTSCGTNTMREEEEDEEEL